jgi:glutathione S-transferase
MSSTVVSALAITIPSEYGWVLIVAAILALEILIIGFAFPGKLRGEYFTKEFMEEHFATEHKQTTGKDIEKGGYPDMGNGRYSAKLSYDKWYKFNNAQRAHMNFIEFAPSTFVLLFIAGIYFPIPSAAIGLAVILGRIAYSIGYTNGGPAGRIIGAFINDIAILGLLGLSLASGIFFIQGK